LKNISIITYKTKKKRKGVLVTQKNNKGARQHPIGWEKKRNIDWLTKIQEELVILYESTRDFISRSFF
jgi:hypothetical protein